MKKLLASKYKLLKVRGYAIIYGRDTVAGKLFDLILLGFILLSAFLTIFESIQIIDEHIHTLLVVLEWIITVFFSIEYALRIICTPNWRRYVFSFYGVIDLISILPIYLSFFVQKSKFLSIIRILRLLRIFRILDLVQFTQQANQLKRALKNSQTKILVFIYFVLVLCVTLGALMYMIEPHDKAFTSIPRSIYWCIVTLTTVGYGDVVPTTAFGQFMASIIMILGYGIIAVPTGIVTAEYTSVSRANILKEEQRRQQKKILANKQSKKIICQQCNNSRHLEGANYCSSCGAPLKKQIDKCPEKNDYF